MKRKGLPTTTLSATSNTPNNTVVMVKNVKKNYRMGDVIVPALKGVSFTVEKGELLSIMGPSGSGKSTLMHLIGCLDRPSSGEIFVFGINTRDSSETQLARIRNREIGFVFQQFNLLPRINILENVMTPLMYAGISTKERKRMAEAVLERVGLKERMKHRPSELSGGERQRVAIARALVTSPRLLLADEPTGALDTKTGQNILELFREINKEGRTIIIVTHDPEVNIVCKRTIHIRDGFIEED